MTVPEALFGVGIDRATNTTQFTIDHTTAGLTDLLRRLGRLTDNSRDVPVGIQRPAQGYAANKCSVAAVPARTFTRSNMRWTA